MFIYTHRHYCIYTQYSPIDMSAYTDTCIFKLIWSVWMRWMRIAFPLYTSIYNQTCVCIYTPYTSIDMCAYIHIYTEILLRWLWERRNLRWMRIYTLQMRFKYTRIYICKTNKWMYMEYIYCHRWRYAICSDCESIHSLQMQLKHTRMYICKKYQRIYMDKIHSHRER